MALGAVREKSEASDSAFDAHAIVAAFGGPACLVARDRTIRAANAQAEPLLIALALGSELSSLSVRPAEPGPLLAARLETAIQTGAPCEVRYVVHDRADTGKGPQSLDITILPSSAEALLLAKDATLERNLIRALVASRELFRDLVTCSADFAWETDAAGHFLYINGGGALGYSADELNGRRGRSLIDHDRSAAFAQDAEPSPFEATKSLEDVEVWLTSAAGAPMCFLISALPVTDGHGVRRGARGVARDVTALRQREFELAAARNRETLSRAILDVTLSETTFSTMLSAAVRAIGFSVQADRAWILLDRSDGTYDTGAAFGIMPYGTRHFLPPDLALPVLQAETMACFSEGGWSYVGVPTRVRGERSGAICIARHQTRSPFDSESLATIELVAKHAAIAIAQAGQLKQLTDLATTDELTGLGNRRALMDGFDEWRAAGPLAKDMGAALLYIDLDDFKRLNDHAGHAAGDMLLKTFAGLLRRDSRRRDMAIRLGGDEFVIWMDGMREESLLERAERLLRAAGDIPLPAPLAPSRLSLSIGAAFVRVKQGTTLNDILTRADAALYAAKRLGKGRIVVAGTDEVSPGTGGVSW